MTERRRSTVSQAALGFRRDEPFRTTAPDRRAARAIDYLTGEQLSPSTRDLLTLEAIKMGADWIDVDEANDIVDEIVQETQARNG